MKKVLVMLIFVASSASGEIYTWTDSRGTAHYTNSEHEIPLRYRTRAKVLDLGIEQKTEGSSPQPGGQTQPTRPAEQPAAQNQDGNHAPQKQKVRGRRSTGIPEE